MAMRPLQIYSTLAWVEAMLSGLYTQGKYALYNPENDSYSVLGVALDLSNYPRVHNDDFASVYPVIARQKTVSEIWFERMFGLPYGPSHYKAVNDLSNNYLACCALLLNAVPPMLQSAKWHELHAKMMSRFKASIGNSVEKTSETDLQSNTVDAVQSDVPQQSTGVVVPLRDRKV